MTIQTETNSLSCTYEMATLIKDLGFNVYTDWSNELYSRDLLKATPSEWSKVFTSLMTYRDTLKGSEKSSVTCVLKRIVVQSNLFTAACIDRKEKYLFVIEELGLKGNRKECREIKTYIWESVITWKF